MIGSSEKTARSVLSGVSELRVPKKQNQKHHECIYGKGSRVMCVSGRWMLYDPDGMRNVLRAPQSVGVNFIAKFRILAF